MSGFDLSPHQDNIFVISAPKPIGMEGKKKDFTLEPPGWQDIQDP